VRLSYGQTGGHAIRCDKDTGAVDWVDLLDEKQPHRLFEATLSCRMLPVAGGIAAYDSGADAFLFVEDPSDPTREPVVLADDYAGLEIPYWGGGAATSLSDFGATRTGPTWALVLGAHLVFNHSDGRFVEMDPLTLETWVIYERSATDFQLLSDGKRVLWTSWCTADELSSGCSGTQIWDSETATSTKKAPFMLISDKAEPWITLDIAGFRPGKSAVHFRAYNLEDGERHTFASELVAPPRRGDHDWIGFRPWRLEGSLTPDAVLVSVPPDPFSWEEDPIPHLYWPHTEALRELELPYESGPIKTDAGLYWPRDGLRLLTTDQQVVVMSEEIASQIIMADGRVARLAGDELRLFHTDGSWDVLESAVTALDVPRWPPGGAVNDLEDLFYVADGMFRRFPLP